MRLAIVGSTQFADDIRASAWAALVIHKHLTIDNVTAVVSGGAKGIDTLAADVARDRGIKLVEYLPKQKRWAPNGFKDRNLLIAQDCDILLCIRHPESKTYGSGWTADRAEEMGKVVYRYMYKEE